MFISPKCRKLRKEHNFGRILSGSRDRMLFLNDTNSLRLHGLCSPWNSPGQNTGVGSLSLLQGIFPTHELNQGLLHWRQTFYPLSHKGSPRILEWVAYPFSSGSSWPRNQMGISCIPGGFFTNWAIREAIRKTIAKHNVAYNKMTVFLSNWDTFAFSYQS